MKKVFLERQVYISWIFVLILAITIFYVSSLSFEGAASTGFLSYLYHFFVFFWLSFFLAIALTQAKKISFVIPAVLSSLFYAVIDEIHQLFVQGRACSFPDFLVDSAGILTANLVYLLTINIRKNKL